MIVTLSKKKKNKNLGIGRVSSAGGGGTINDRKIISHQMYPAAKLSISGGNEMVYNLILKEINDVASHELD